MHTICSKNNQNCVYATFFPHIYLPRRVRGFRKIRNIMISSLPLRKRTVGEGCNHFQFLGTLLGSLPCVPGISDILEQGVENCLFSYCEYCIEVWKLQCVFFQYSFERKLCLSILISRQPIITQFPGMMLQRHNLEYIVSTCDISNNSNVIKALFHPVCSFFFNYN